MFAILYLVSLVSHLIILNRLLSQFSCFPYNNRVSRCDIGSLDKNAKICFLAAACTLEKYGALNQRYFFL